MANERCAECGALIALVGIRHRCTPRVVTVSQTAPDQKELADSSSESSASSTYRYRDPVKRRAQMRDYMKRKRAEKKGA